MRVSAISNNYVNSKKNNTNFTATFKMTKDIETMINASTYENMVRFKDILKRIKKVKDDFVYIFEKKSYTNEVLVDDIFEHYETQTTTGFELSRYKVDNPSQKEWVGGFEDDFYRPKLGEINDRLEYVYPQRAGKITKGKMKAEIKKLMV